MRVSTFLFAIVIPQLAFGQMPQMPDMPGMPHQHPMTHAGHGMQMNEAGMYLMTMASGAKRRSTARCAST